MASHEPMEGHKVELPSTPNRGELWRVYETMTAAAEVEPDVNAKMYYNETVQLVAAAFYFDADPLWVIGILEGLYKQSETVTGYYKALGLSQYYGAWELRGDVIQHTIKLFRELPSVRERGVWAEIGERVEYVDPAEVRGHALFRDAEGRLHRWAVIRTDNPDCLMDGTLHLMSPGRLREDRQRRAMPDKAREGAMEDRARDEVHNEGPFILYAEGAQLFRERIEGQLPDWMENEPPKLAEAPESSRDRPRSRWLEPEDPRREEYARATEDHREDPSPFGAPRLEDFTGEADVSQPPAGWGEEEDEPFNVIPELPKGETFPWHNDAEREEIAAEADSAAYNEAMEDIERMREEDGHTPGILTDDNATRHWIRDGDSAEPPQAGERD